MTQYSTLIYVGVLIVAFYLLLIRPQQQRQKQHSKLVASLGVGDRVMTAGGLYGTVREVRDDSLMLEVASGVVVEVAKGAVNSKAEAG